ncbi:MAG: protein kinase [Myxococcaceae bacterium]|nr:protein kinase [Myxococcaceae bacterium]
MLPLDSLVLEGRFRVIRPLGSGGMGAVYLGEQVSLGRKVAIKVLHHDLHKQHGMLERFKREARLLSAVEHPTLVRIIDFGESEHSACLVMELVEGESLFELLQSGPLAPTRALTMLRQLAEGLAAIHEKGIIHRDIKPENVFLTRTPRGEQARLLDFGIARLVEPDADSNVSQVGVVLGTPEYMSPEQAIGARLDERSDLYCLGVLAYRVLSGQLPFDGPSPRHYISQHANAAPLPLDRAAPALAVNPALVALVMRLLEKDPTQRFQNAQALADALAEAASGPLPETVTPPSVQAPTPSGPVSSGTSVFGAAPPVPPPGSPPVSSGTSIFGTAPPVPPQGPAPIASSAAASRAAPPVPAPGAPPVSSGTAAFGAAPPVPTQAPVPISSNKVSPRMERASPRTPPPVGSGLAVFGAAPRASSPAAPLVASSRATFGKPSPAPLPVAPAAGSDRGLWLPASASWDPSADGDTAVARGSPPAAVPWEPSASGDTDVARGSAPTFEFWDAPTGTSTPVLGRAPRVASPLPPPTGSGTAAFGASPPPPPAGGSPGVASVRPPVPSGKDSSVPSLRALRAPPSDVLAENLTLMLTSVQGFAELASQRTREEQLRALETYEQLLLPLLREYGGKLVQKLGDLVLGVFASPTSAVLCGMGMQDRLWRHNQGLPPESQLHVRICIHAGEVLLTQDTVVGEPTETVKAVEQVALGGEVTFTESVDLSRDSAEVVAEACGTLSLPGRGEPLKLYRSQHTATEGPPFGGRDLVGAPTEKRPVLPWKTLLGTRTHRLAGVGLIAGLLLLGGVGLWQRNRSPEVQARRLLEAGKPAEALLRLDMASGNGQKSPELRQLRALALHRLERHAVEHDLLLGLAPDSLEDLEAPLLDGLAEDFGADEGNKPLRKLLGALPKDRLHGHFEALAEGDASPKQWGALRYLESAQDTQGLDLVELYVTALASEDCEVRARAARRLGALGDADAVPALTKLARPSGEQQQAGAKKCGQDAAAEALRTLTKSN